MRAARGRPRHIGYMGQLELVPNHDRERLVARSFHPRNRSTAWSSHASHANGSREPFIATILALGQQSPCARECVILIGVAPCSAIASRGHNPRRQSLGMKRRDAGSSYRCGRRHIANAASWCARVDGNASMIE